MKSADPLWDQMIVEAKQLALNESILADYFDNTFEQLQSPTHHSSEVHGPRWLQSLH